MGHGDLDAETAGERQARIRDLSRERPAPDRVRRSDELEEMRSDRAEALEDIREHRAAELKVEDALRRERINVRLEFLEREIKAINGAVSLAAENFKRCEEANDKLTDKLDEIINAQKLRDAVADTTQRMVEKQSKGQIKRRDLVLTVITIVIALAAVATQISTAAGH